mmetsp:Transcript_131979/g.228741  ORF Transcript_131979/g.228741 Transcript_131979/m.228741 type:complete len:258 (-) Transcript_131979:382-1155(-)
MRRSLHRCWHARRSLESRTRSSISTAGLLHWGTLLGLLGHGSWCTWPTAWWPLGSGTPSAQRVLAVGRASLSSSRMRSRLTTSSPSRQVGSGGSPQSSGQLCVSPRGSGGRACRLTGGSLGWHCHCAVSESQHSPQRGPTQQDGSVGGREGRRAWVGFCVSLLLAVSEPAEPCPDGHRWETAQSAVFQLVVFPPLACLKSKGDLLNSYLLPWCAGRRSRAAVKCIVKGTGCRIQLALLLIGRGHLDRVLAQPTRSPF